MKKQLLYSLLTVFLVAFSGKAQVGFTCSNAIEITSLPFQTTDNTANYGDLTDVSQGISCGSIPSTTNYLAGNEVFYSYVSDFTGYLNIVMQPLGAAATNSSVFVYESCSNVGAACSGGMANANSDLREVNVLVIQGQTYKIVVSSSAETQTVAFKLTLEKNQCSPKPTNLSAPILNTTSATLSWENPGNYSSWQIAVQPAGSSIPAGAGESTTSNEFTQYGLTANTAYQFWVRGECSAGNNTFSQWAGPFAFTTLLCTSSNTCNYTFILSDSGNNGWNGASMQIIQNGFLKGSFGQGYISNTSASILTMQLCKNAPFEIFWNAPGTAPQEVGLTVKNSFGQILYVKQATDLPNTTIYSGANVSCSASICFEKPSNVVATQASATSATVNWTSAAAESWDIFIIPSSQSTVPNELTVPTYSAVQKPFTLEGLSQNGNYKIFVRSNCSSYIKSAWSLVSNLNLVTTCFTPGTAVVTDITTSAALLTWQKALSSDQAWEVLFIPITEYAVPTTTPSANPILENGAFITSVTGSNAQSTITNLTTATNYVCYVRTVCSTTDKSDWSLPTIFSTSVCSPTNTCNYKFILTNASNNNWNYGRIQVKQNGAVVKVLGSGGVNSSNGLAVNLCANIPFEVYWSVAGNEPQNIGFQIINAAQDIIYTKLPGEGTPLTTLFSSTETCVPPTCPKPTYLSVNSVAQTTAQLSWDETGSATQWEVYVAAPGMPLPINGTPLNTGVASYLIATTNVNFSISELNPGTNYVYYVRAICSITDIGSWTILSPKAFVTKPVNDECAAAIPLQVNPSPVMVQTAVGTTVGGTASMEISACPGSENDDVWYSFVATNTYHIVKLLNVTGSTTYVRFAVYEGSDCASLTQIMCSTNNINTGLLKDLSIGTTYKIRVYTNGSISSQSSLFEIGIATPNLTNDECTSATTIIVSDQIATTTPTLGTLTGATASAQVSTCPGTEDDDVWFQFTAFGSNQIIKIGNVIGTTAGGLNFSVYEGSDCDNLTLISCYTGGNATVPMLITGQEYKIRVWSSGTALDEITFDITVTNVYPPLMANTTQFTVPQLVTNVLVNNPCVTISNITSGTGPTTATNGIGYFTNLNPTFPISNGLILSTGNAANAGGPNNSTVSDGGAAGDADLENFIQISTGTSLLSYNATKLEFDFTSQNQFMSFNFVFASEEYGTFQCQYADAFAFLLTDLTTGITTNLAVVPGTTTPISVITIRDSANNSSCTSENVGFFGSFNTINDSVPAPINFNGQTTLMSASSAIIANNPYHIKMVIADRGDTFYDSAVFLQAGSFSSGPPQCTDKVELIAFIDNNNDGIKQVTESSFTYGSFVYQLNDAGELNNISSPIGNYTIYDGNPLNSYDFTYSIHPEFAAYFETGATTHSNITIPAGSGTQTLYFPITQIQGYNDVTVSVSPIGQPVAGFSYTNKIVYTNLGTATTSGIINYTKDAAVSVSSLQSGVTLTPTGFTYNFANLAPFETRSFMISMSVPSIPIINIDDVLTSSVQISAPANDINVNNNTFEMSQIVVASYDPNDKVEAHGDKLYIDTFNQDDYLFYTVRFQNTGTANAISVRVEDLLDAQLDETSVRMVSASHNYVMERVGNQLVWKFDYIYLPSQLANEELSNGYLTFKVKVKPGFAVGDIIPNFAEIYFDTNPAIVTNTFLSEFKVNLGVKTFSTNNILIYPNPTNSVLHVNLQDTNESLAKIVIYDMIGKVIKTVAGNSVQETAINVADFATGVYMIEITTDTNIKQTRKFIVN